MPTWSRLVAMAALEEWTVTCPSRIEYQRSVSKYAQCIATSSAEGSRQEPRPVSAEGLGGGQPKQY